MYKVKQLLSVFTLYYRLDVIKSTIPPAEFKAADYTICSKVGKAVIVSNFMGEYNPSKQSKDPECRGYASEDCADLERELKRLGFEPLSGDEQNGMVYKNYTKKQLTDLYKRGKISIYRTASISVCVCY